MEPCFGSEITFSIGTNYCSKRLLLLLPPPPPPPLLLLLLPPPLQFIGER